MKKFLTISTLTILISLLTFVISVEISSETELIKGKNNLVLPIEFKPIYVKDFILKNPEIQAITYNQSGQTGGYINYLQGIGENFILRPTKQYEIISSRNISINLG